MEKHDSSNDSSILLGEKIFTGLKLMHLRPTRIAAEGGIILRCFPLQVINEAGRLTSLIRRTVSDLLSLPFVVSLFEASSVIYLWSESPNLTT